MTSPLPVAEFEEIYRKVPRLTVEILVLDDCSSPHVLLTRRDSGPCAGRWHVPGGTVRFAEPLKDAVIRVARTELGVEVTGSRLAGCIEYPGHYLNGLDHPVGVVFWVTWTGEPDALEGASEAGWFLEPPDGMHDEQAAFLAAYLKAYR